MYRYSIGDMDAVYVLDQERRIMGMYIAPRGTEYMRTDFNRVQSLVQLKIIGDMYAGNYFGGTSMKYAESTEKMKFKSIKSDENENGVTVTVRLEDERGLCAIHTLEWKRGTEYAVISTALENNSGVDVKIEMLSSFSMFSLPPDKNDACENSLLLHRLRSKWSQEGRLISETLEDLQLEECWCYGNANSVRFGQVGSMPVKGYFPFMALEDTKSGTIWGVQMGCPTSWQMEVTRNDNGVCLSGGLADREFGHWMKTIKAGERFVPPSAVVSVCRGNIDDISHRLVSAQEPKNLPESEEGLPIIFNEYCTTWGNPSHSNICSIVDAVKNKGIDYFVIDCGWFKEEGVPWDRSMGDYEVSPVLFPEGIDKTVSVINKNGMKAGIWFEIEAVGSAAKAYHYTDHLLKRDGITLTTVNRRFWDLNDEWVQKYLEERVIGFLKAHGFEYMKVDYNETIGIGCDNEDSLGEGLRKNMEKSVEFFEKIRSELPDIVLENCASGGNRLEPTYMGLTSMASFSDAHESIEIPIIAANLHRAILPRQSQIWCVIRENDSLKRIAYSVSATFLGRMCLSGDVTGLSAEQWKVIDDGIAFYKTACGAIKYGKSRRYGPKVTSERHPNDWQAVVRSNDKETLVVIHCFDTALPEEIRLPVPHCNVKAVYSYDDVDVRVENGILVYKPTENMKGIGVYLV